MRAVAASPHRDDSVEEGVLDAFFDALGDANRRAIVHSLAQREQSVQELADAFPISRPAVSRHLRQLKGAGLVTDRPEGTRRIYRLSTDGADAATRYLTQMWGEAAARFTIVVENLEP